MLLLMNKIKIRDMKSGDEEYLTKEELISKLGDTA